MSDVTPPPPRASRPAQTAVHPFTCDLRVEGRSAGWIIAGGEWDLAGSPEFTRTLNEALRRAQLVVVDLRSLTFIDSTGLHAILDADAHARTTGRRLVLIRGCEQVNRLFTLIGLTDRLNIIEFPPGPAT